MLIVPEFQKTQIVDKIINKFYVKSGTSIKDTVAIMNKNKIGSIAIVNNNLHLIGIFTERTLITKVISTKKTIRDFIDSVMISSVKTISFDSTMEEAFVIMFKNNYRYLPVVTNENEFKGFIDAKMFVEFLSEVYRSTILNIAPENVPNPEYREGA